MLNVCLVRGLMFLPVILFGTQRGHRARVVVIQADLNVIHVYIATIQTFAQLTLILENSDGVPSAKRQAALRAHNYVPTRFKGFKHIEIAFCTQV